MATAELHPMFRDFSGKSGNFIYRRTNGRTVVATRPDGTVKPASAAQEEARNRFRAAGLYTRQVLADPLQRRSYERLARERKRRADRIVTSDYLTPPVVEEIEVSGYQRQPGGLVRVFAVDDVEVVSVQVAIATAAGEPVESGPATTVHGVWCYTATAQAPAGVGLTITATAKDRPGNAGVGTATYQAG